MSIRIELSPDEERAFVDRARLSGQDPALLACKLIRDCLATSPSDPPDGLDALIDSDFVADCAGEPEEPVPTIEEVREAMSKIPGSLAEEIIKDREDRF